MRASGVALDLLVLAVAVAHVVLTPYTKVEESFNLQAAHDVLFHGADLAAYDHHEFPGVVPRTFIGALALGAITAPFKAYMDASYADYVGGNKMVMQLAVRIALAALVTLALGRFRRALRRKLGTVTAAAFMLLTATQFHLPFYMSRTLPNTFALILTTFGAADWIDEGRFANPRRAVFLLTAAAVVFRCDAVLLLAPVGLHMLATRAFTLPGAVAWGACCLQAALAATIIVDTIMWRPKTSEFSSGSSSSSSSAASTAASSGDFWPGADGVFWPEGRVLWFNTAENRSGEWGVSPAHWYFTSALPRSLLLAYPLAILGAVLERRVRVMVACAFFMIGAYSFLPHKELRFIFPALPLLNAAAAAGVARVWNNRGKGGVWALMCVGVAGAWALSLVAHGVFAMAAHHNYPGGVALARLHAYDPGYVHIDAAAAMSGVSRFGEAVPEEGAMQEVLAAMMEEDYADEGMGSWMNKKGFGRGASTAQWRYSKEEYVAGGAMAGRGFDYLVGGEPKVPGYVVVETVEGFSRLALNKTAFPPRLGVVTAPQIYILKRLAEETMRR